MKTVRLAAILAAALLLGACRNLFTELEPPPSGQGTLFLSFGSGGGFSSARTILPTAPEFSRYELEFVNPPRETLSLLASSTTLYLNPGVYTVIGKGYTGTTLTARSDPTDITISPGGTVSAQIALKPYTESAVHGVLSYSLALEGIAPVQAELLIETYTAIEGLAPNTPIPADWILPRRDYAQDPTEEEALAWNPPAELSLGSEP
ncbi:MAG: hypothetical protein LBU19_01030, partial [Treponema sp.]|nr:hypothetical protein [Treponema sp.]